MMLSSAEWVPPSWAKGLRTPHQRVHLGQFPTPLHRFHPPGFPASCRWWVKRDDMTGLSLSGNKVRKLEFILQEAKSKGHDCVVTIGGLQSNHCRATAVAARYLGLDSHLILRIDSPDGCPDTDPALVGNLMLSRLVGAEIRIVSKKEYQQHGWRGLLSILEAELTAAGKSPFVIEVGGSNALGNWGYVEMVRELEKQLTDESAENKPPKFSEIVMACGSGGTAAGIGLAVHHSSHPALSGTTVRPIAVCDTEEYFYTVVGELLSDMGCGGELKGQDIVEMTMGKGVGYAQSTQSELEYILQVSQTTGVLLDPVYSGKALYTISQLAKSSPEQFENKDMLFVHTGGIFGLYDRQSELMPLIPVDKTSRLFKAL